MPSTLEHPRQPHHHAIQNYKRAPSHIRLPSEVIWMIIEEVDLPSASQCALAASCFLYPARRRLFHKIRLFETEYDEHMSSSVGDRVADFFGLHRKDLTLRRNRCMQLVEILDAAVEIRGLVKELIIEGRTSNDTLNPISSWYSPHYSPLSPVLSRLHSLESISFLFPLSRPLLFQCLPLQSAHAVIRAVQSPLLRTVVLENVLFENSASNPTDLLYFIRACSLGGGLSELAISEHYTSDQSQDMWMAIIGQHQHDLHEVEMERSKWRLKDLLPLSAYSSRDEQIPLASLSVTGTGFLTRVFLDWAMDTTSPISLTKLRSLTLGGLSRNSIKRASHVIRRSGQTLQHLTFAQESYHSSPFPISLPTTVTSDDLIPVQNLRFVENHWDELRSFPTLLRWCTIIESSCFRKLTQFTVDIHWYLDSIARASRFWSVSWHRLESALHRVAPTAMLCVNITMVLSHFSDDQVTSRWSNIIGPESGTSLAECFPLAHRKKGGFVFNVAIEGPICTKELYPSYQYTPQGRWIQA